jgi:hypothetical protein
VEKQYFDTIGNHPFTSIFKGDKKEKKLQVYNGGEADNERNVESKIECRWKAFCNLCV